MLNFNSKFYETGYPDIIMWLRKHAADNMVYVCWEPVDATDSGESQMLRCVVDGFIANGKWVIIK